MMLRKCSIYIITTWLIFVPKHVAYSQTTMFTTGKTAFSSTNNIEQSPVSTPLGILFCTDITVKKGKNPNSINQLFYIAQYANTNNKASSFFSDTTDIYHVATNSNNSLLSLVQHTGAYTGINFLQKQSGEWIYTDPFPYNNSYAITSSCFIHDSLLILCSDMPGGYGGFDLYMSVLKQGNWSQPVNAGPVINTIFDETFPYYANSDKLVFSSNRPGGLGMNDIYYSQRMNNTWMPPVHLDATINSEYDDYSLITTDDFATGYFTTNRSGNADIYSFTRHNVNFSYCKKQKETALCYQFFDQQSMYPDSTTPYYQWDFGNGDVLIGDTVLYCFPDFGTFSITLRIIDKATNDTINAPLPYGLNIRKPIQPFIESPDTILLNEQASINGKKSNLPYTHQLDYLWELPNGTIWQGPYLPHNLLNKGDNLIKMSIIGRKHNEAVLSEQCVYKHVFIIGEE